MKRSLLPMAALLLLCAGCSTTPSSGPRASAAMASSGPRASAAMASTGHLEMTAVASTGALELTSERVADPVPAP